MATVRISLKQHGDKWHVTMKGTGYKPEVYEYESEDQAQRAMQNVLEAGKHLQSTGVVTNISTGTARQS